MNYTQLTGKNKVEIDILLKQGMSMRKVVSVTEESEELLFIDNNYFLIDILFSSLFFIEYIKFCCPGLFTYISVVSLALSNINFLLFSLSKKAILLSTNIPNSYFFESELKYLSVILNINILLSLSFAHKYIFSSFIFSS